ncbi:MAG: hypothetical protein NVS3B10_31850 [Polyangiales bacterium]
MASQETPHALTIDAPGRPGSTMVMASPKEVGDRVQTLRRERGWTQLDLAAEARVSPSTVYRVEAGEAPLDGPAALLVLSVFGLDGGRSLSASPSTMRSDKPTLASNMGQMIGRLQLPAGVDDFYSELLKLAIERDDPPHVFKALAEARGAAPADAGLGWWMKTYLDAAENEPPRSRK